MSWCVLMGKCPNCDKQGMFLKTVNCRICGKEICNNCGIDLLDIKLRKGTRLEEAEYDAADTRFKYGSIEETWYVCSDECIDRFQREVEAHFSAEDLELDSPQYIYYSKSVDWLLDDAKKALARDKTCYARIARHAGNKIVKRTIRDPTNKEWLTDKVSDIIKHGVKWFAAPPWPECNRQVRRKSKRGKNYWDDIFLPWFIRKIILVKAQEFEKAGRYEEAANLYEMLKMPEEAGRLRHRDREFVVKKIEVSVDLNSLLQQVKESGLVVIYRCPRCGGNIKISRDSSATSLTTCQYCGSEIATIDLINYLKTALS
jgi:DNA-directed RNA polymerase subunit RPC12/RpoP